MPPVAGISCMLINVRVGLGWARQSFIVAGTNDRIQTNHCSPFSARTHNCLWRWLRIASYHYKNQPSRNGWPIMLVILSKPIDILYEWLTRIVSSFNSCLPTVCIYQLLPSCSHIISAFSASYLKHSLSRILRKERKIDKSRESRRWCSRTYTGEMSNKLCRTEWPACQCYALALRSNSEAAFSFWNAGLQRQSHKLVCGAR